MSRKQLRLKQYLLQWFTMCKLHGENVPYNAEVGCSLRKKHKNPILILKRTYLLIIADALHFLYN